MIYGTLAGWREYASDRGDNAPTEAAEAVASAALQRASDYIRFTYVTHFIEGCTLSDDVISEAAYIAASLELATPGFFTRTYTPSEQKVLTGVGSIRWTATGQDGALTEMDGATPVSTAIDGMLRQCMPRNKPGVGLRAVNA